MLLLQVLPIFLVHTYFGAWTQAFGAPGIEGSSLRKELDGWDPEDDPWAEHVSHAKVDNRAQQSTFISWFCM